MNKIFWISISIFIVMGMNAAVLPDSLIPPNMSAQKTPTATPIPDPLQVPQKYLDGISVEKADDFSTGQNWNICNQNCLIKDGILSVTGKTFWSSGSEWKSRLKEGEGVIIQYKFSPNPEMELYLDHDTWMKDDYRRFGVYQAGGPRANLFKGKNYLGGGALSGNFSPLPNTWYSLLIGVAKGGDFIALIWDPQSPNKVVRYREVLGKSWSNLLWKFSINANKGSIDFDNFQQLSFDGIKKK